MPDTVSDIRITESQDAAAELMALCQELRKLNEELRKSNEEKDKTIAKLTSQLEYLTKQMFGSRSEKCKDVPGQIGLFDAEEPAAPEPGIPPEEAEYIEVRGYKKEKKKRPTYDEQFGDIPTVDRMVDPLPEEERVCAECGSVMEPIGKEKVREEIEYIPASLVRTIWWRNVYACPNSKDEADTEVLKDHAPESLIPGSYVSAGLAAHVMYYKFALANPLYRQEQDLLRLGAHVTRATMARWIIYCSRSYFAPVIGQMEKDLTGRRYLMMDETPIQVLREQDRRAQTKSYVWVMRSGEDKGPPVILYRYTETRKGANAAEFLKGAPPGFFLMTDGYRGYNLVPGAKRCACWAHIRRYWKKAIPKGKEKDYTLPAVQGFLYCEKLFAYERSYREKGYSAEKIHEKRLKDEEPVIDAFLAWMDGLRPSASDAPLQGAITYTEGCRPYLKTYLEDGCASFTNNLSENAIRPVVVGRKNWLFSDTPEGAEATVTVMSLIGTAKANGLDPERYLRFLLDRRPSEQTSAEELGAMMPWSADVHATCGKQPSGEGTGETAEGTDEEAPSEPAA